MFSSFSVGHWRRPERGNETQKPHFLDVFAWWENAASRIEPTAGRLRGQYFQKYLPWQTPNQDIKP